MSGYVGDGLDGAKWNMAQDGSVQTGPGDASMLCIFYKRAVHNAIKSARDGRPIYDDIDFVKIQHPGERLNIVEREANDSDKRRWPAQWNAYAVGKDQVAEGTPLGLLFPRHPSQIAMLQALGIMTVEHLANASATAIEAIGMHGQDYVNYAQKYIKGAQGGAAFHQMQMEVETAKMQNVRLQKQVEDMANQMQALNVAISGQVAGGPRAPNYQPAPAPAQAFSPAAAAPVPSFGGSVFDTQTTMINSNHESTEQAATRKGGWPKGKLRGKKTTDTTDAA